MYCSTSYGFTADLCLFPGHQLSENNEIKITVLKARAVVGSPGTAIVLKKQQRCKRIPTEERLFIGSGKGPLGVGAALPRSGFFY